MRANRGRDTGPELAVRRALHARGLRYRVDHPLPFDRRRRADIAFTRVKVAVFIDGCFWHGCPEHGTTPRTNSAFWSAKIARNRARDADTTGRLEAAGWSVLRFWEHDDPDRCAELIARMIGRSPDGH
jgi:DNA mismatch endonuclease (patch repair protein)